MAFEETAIPADAEVRRQLNRMLEGKRMKSSPSRAMVLQYVVEQALEGKELSEDIIGYALFPNYVSDVSDDVRVTAHHLRQSLSKYYAEEGINDLVRIELPVGAKYRVQFGYNPRSRAHRLYARGMEMLAHMRLGEARKNLGWAIAAEANFAEPGEALAEVHLLSSLCPPDLSFQEPEVLIAEKWTTKQRLPQIRSLLDASLLLNPKSPRVHLLLGAVHACERKWAEAGKSFANALELDRAEVPFNAWYLAWQVSQGELEAATQSMKAKIRDFQSAPGLLTLYGLMLYLRREYIQAAKAFSEALKIDREYWPAAIGQIAVFLEGRFLAEEGVTIEPDFALNQMCDSRVPLTTMFPGLFVLCLARAGKIKEAQRAFAKEFDRARSHASQRALAHMGLGETGKAIEALSRAVDDCDPLMLWLDLWPVFDPLRKEPGFRKLIRRMKLASTQKG